MDEAFQCLLQGIDTLQCAYFLAPHGKTELNFRHMAEVKESIRQAKSKSPAPFQAGGRGFLLQPYGTASGYPFVLENEDFKIECGEFNKPNFFVTFRSQALWRESAWLLHDKFLKWARTAGFAPYRPESLSRIDFSFDYHLPTIDFNENSFKSRSNKDSQYRENGRVQTFSFGKGDVVLRVYDKVAEIQQQSSKVWFFLLWGIDMDVWRIEWQVRKPVLKRFGIATFEDLQDLQGDLLRYLASEHDTLRQPNGDSNESRWPLHPLWKDLQARIADLKNQGVHRVIGMPAVLDERMQRMAISIFGYLKRVAAIHCIQSGKAMVDAEQALWKMEPLLRELYEPLAWQADVKKRIQEMQLGQW
ncbi:hypothetical protein [Desulfuromonas versatilis]|nr:hypothetical protein [Desulfuromonas versatilis]